MSCFLGFKTHAQLGFCTGSSGDPIFTEDFGTGTTNTPLAPGITTYTFASVNPQDGFYTVSNNTGFFDWHNTTDHTPGDTNGKCLIVNADFVAGEFYRTTIANLCGGTTYEFSAWLLNLLPPSGCGGQGIDVNVRFEIWDSTDTNLLAIGDTGNISESSSPIWQQYGLVFQTLPAQSVVILKMINNGGGGCGNDLAIDDIVFKSCGDFVSVEDSTNNNSISLCSTQTPFITTLTANPDFTVFSTHFYQWQESTNGAVWNDIPGEFNQSISVSVTSTMYYRVKVAEVAANLSNPQCILFSDEYEIIINQAPNMPVVECWETATFNESICDWEISGTQPTQPATECWEVATFNNVICDWEVTGTQPIQPITECWETATFNDVLCNWEVTGTQPQEPTELACWETAGFNDVLCEWEITGTQPIEPTTTCNEVAEFNFSACVWDIIPIDDEPILETLFFCEDDDVELSADIDNATYLWSTDEITKEITVDQAGTYTVEITDSDGCITTKIITLNTIEPPIVESINSDGNSIRINLASVIDYEYSLDGISFQFSNIFLGVAGGFYTIYIRDINECNTISVGHLHFIIPQFMTPNGDTYNDTFNLNGIEFYQSSEVYIFNRYGKLLKSTKNSSFEWDGTFNNQPLPNDDYWYLIKIEGQTFTGHFTLKR